VEDVALKSAEGAREEAHLPIGGADPPVAAALVVGEEGILVAAHAIADEIIGWGQHVDRRLLILVRVGVLGDAVAHAALQHAARAVVGDAAEAAAAKRRADERVLLDEIAHLVAVLDVNRRAAQIVHHILLDRRVVRAVDRDPFVDAAVDDDAAHRAARALAHEVEVDAVLPERDAAAALDARPLHHHQPAARLHGRDPLAAADRLLHLAPVERRPREDDRSVEVCHFGVDRHDAVHHLAAVAVGERRVERDRAARQVLADGGDRPLLRLVIRERRRVAVVDDRRVGQRLAARRRHHQPVAHHPAVALLDDDGSAARGRRRRERRPRRLRRAVDEEGAERDELAVAQAVGLLHVGDYLAV